MRVRKGGEGDRIGEGSEQWDFSQKPFSSITLSSLTQQSFFSRLKCWDMMRWDGKNRSNKIGVILISLLPLYKKMTTKIKSEKTLILVQKLVKIGQNWSIHLPKLVKKW